MDTDAEPFSIKDAVAREIPARLAASDCRTRRASRALLNREPSSASCALSAGGIAKFWSIFILSIKHDTNNTATTITDKSTKINQHVCYFMRNDSMACFNGQIDNEMDLRWYRRQWKKQSHFRRRQNDESMVMKKHCSTVILGVVYHRVGSNFQANGAIKGIGQQCTTKPSSLKILIDRQPTEPNHRDRRIPRKLLADVGRQLGPQQAGRCERVVAANSVVGIKSNEAGCYAAPAVLRNLLPEVTIQGLGTTVECRAIMLVIE